MEDERTLTRDYPLHWAVLNDQQAISGLLRAGRRIDELNEDGQSPVFLAIDSNQSDVVATLLHDPSPLPDGDKCMALAIRNTSIPIIVALVRRGIISPDALLTICMATERAYRPSELSYDKEDYPEYKFGSATWMALMSAWEKNQRMWFTSDIQQTVEMLINGGVSPDHCISGSLTPLYYAALNNCVPLVRLLLELGADPNGGGGSPMTGSMWYGCINVTIMLLKAGAVPSQEQKVSLELWRKLFPEIPAECIIEPDAPKDTRQPTSQRYSAGFPVECKRLSYEPTPEQWILCTIVWIFSAFLTVGISSILLAFFLDLISFQAWFLGFVMVILIPYIAAAMIFRTGTGILEGNLVAILSLLRQSPFYTGRWLGSAIIIGFISNIVVFIVVVIRPLIGADRAVALWERYLALFNDS
ncbi:MAG: ankyrin repeat domain-containing protein [Candidatus Riflebacteria bacterium]|nr:ankyrin repeat domain-containing protein [Candidatus Riflebacteria bacterium]